MGTGLNSPHPSQIIPFNPPLPCSTDLDEGAVPHSSADTEGCGVLRCRDRALEPNAACCALGAALGGAGGDLKVGGGRGKWGDTTPHCPTLGWGGWEVREVHVNAAGGALRVGWGHCTVLGSLCADGQFEVIAHTDVQFGVTARFRSLHTGRLGSLHTDVQFGVSAHRCAVWGHCTQMCNMESLHTHTA